jgi:hypothetical protein
VLVRQADTSPPSLGRTIAASLGSITLQKVTEVGFANARANAERIASGQSIAALRDTPLADGGDALVVAAGPSLHRIDTARVIRESGFRGTIIATDSSMSWCLRNGITPDLVVTLDPHPTRIVRWFGDPGLDEAALREDDPFARLDDAYYARQDMDPGFRDEQLAKNAELVQLIDENGSRMRIAISSSAAPAVAERVAASGMEAFWWNPMYDDYDAPNSLTHRIRDMNGLPCVNAGGNVGSACWVFAHAVLGKSRVGLVGVDFGYYSDTPYERTQYFDEIVSLVGSHRLDDVFVRVHNPHVGKEFYTDPAYLWFRDSFLEMVETAECETYNCTGGGILFGPGIHWSGLAEFLSGSPAS